MSAQVIEVQEAEVTSLVTKAVDGVLKMGCWMFLHGSSVELLNPVRLVGLTNCFAGITDFDAKTQLGLATNASIFFPCLYGIVKFGTQENASLFGVPNDDPQPYSDPEAFNYLKDYLIYSTLVYLLYNIKRHYRRGVEVKFIPIESTQDPAGIIDRLESEIEAKHDQLLERYTLPEAGESSLYITLFHDLKKVSDTLGYNLAEILASGLYKRFESRLES